MKVDVLAMLDSFAEAAFFGFEEDRIKAGREAISALICAADEVVGEYAARFGTESGGHVGPLDYEIRALSEALDKVAP